MSSRCRCLLFDAGGTLFDHDRAEVGALARTFARFDLLLASGTTDAYRVINGQCWQALEWTESGQTERRGRRTHAEESPFLP